MPRRCELDDDDTIKSNSFHKGSSGTPCCYRDGSIDYRVAHAKLRIKLLLLISCSCCLTPVGNIPIPLFSCFLTIFYFKIKKMKKKNEKDTRASKELYKAGLEGAERYQDRL